MAISPKTSTATISTPTQTLTNPEIKASSTTSSGATARASPAKGSKANVNPGSKNVELDGGEHDIPENEHDEPEQAHVEGAPIKKKRKRMSKTKKWKVGCSWQLVLDDSARNVFNSIDHKPLTQHLQKLIEARLDVSSDSLADTTYEIAPCELAGIMEGSRSVINLNHNMYQNDKGYVSVRTRGKHYYMIPRRKAQGGAA
jgi:hypothetical protein